MDQRDITAGEYLITQKKLEGVIKNIEGSWLTEAWTYQKKMNELLRALIRKLEEGR